MSKGPERVYRKLLAPVARALRKDVLPWMFPAPAHRFPRGLKDVRVVGLLSSASGLGRSARLCSKVLSQSGYRVSGADVARLYRSDDGLELDGCHGDASDAQVSIYHLNPPMLLPGIVRTNPVRFWRSYNVGYWAWELEVLPREWIRGIDLVDAVMVPSTFCKRAVEQHTRKPVIVVPHPVAVDDGVARLKDDAPGDGPFRIVSIFNLGSSFERKNPLASVQAFRLAFGNDTSVELILKISDGIRYPNDRKKLVDAIGSFKNVRLVDETWEEARLAELLRTAHAYLSTHRSEGFGLALAEAIAAGVPLVTTGWSGNMDFCLPDLCFLVDFKLVPVRDAHLAFRGLRNAVWAEPSIEHAALQLRAVRSDWAGARIKAVKLRAYLRSYLSATTYPEALAQLANGRTNPCAPALDRHSRNMRPVQ